MIEPAGRIFLPGLGPLSFQLPEDGNDRDQAQGNTDNEDAAPAEMVRQEPTHERTDGKADVDGGDI